MSNDPGMSAMASTVKLGSRIYDVGSCQVGELRDSSEVRRDVAELRRRFNDDGYIFIRGLLPAEAVANAREAVLSMDKAGSDQGRVESSELLRNPDLLGVTEHPELFRLFEDFFGEPCATFDYKWLRAVKPGESSGFHMDSVYMNRGSQRLLTCWIPLGDVSFELGGLAVLRGSHQIPGYDRVRCTYGELDLDAGDVGGTGWFTEDPEEALHWGGRFETAHFKVGDAVFFGMKTLHGSSVNRAGILRLSCDVRFQPKSETIDPRWVWNSEGKISGEHSRWALHRHDRRVFPRSMEDAKKHWEVHWKSSSESPLKDCSQLFPSDVSEPPSKKVCR